MDIYGISTPDYFRIDDLLDLSNDELFSSSTSTSSSSATVHHHLPPPENPSIHHFTSSSSSFNAAVSTDFTDQLSVPSDDVAELEWLSQFVDDSFADIPANSLAGTINVQADASFSVGAHSKCSRGTVTNTANWISVAHSESPAIGKPKSKKQTDRASSPTEDGGVRRCTHCASERTPQWRSGPLGPKTLCNACGVRYKSGRLVPEYRPAASPTFVLTQHSNSHRKVMELRRQKEMRLQQDQDQQHIYNHQQEFRVC